MAISTETCTSDASSSGSLGGGTDGSGGTSIEWCRRSGFGIDLSDRETFSLNAAIRPDDASSDVVRGFSPGTSVTCAATGYNNDNRRGSFGQLPQFAH